MSEQTPIDFEQLLEQPEVSHLPNDLELAPSEIVYGTQTNARLVAEAEIVGGKQNLVNRREMYRISDGAGLPVTTFRHHNDFESAVVRITSPKVQERHFLYTVNDIYRDVLSLGETPENAQKITYMLLERPLTVRDILDTANGTNPVYTPELVDISIRHLTKGGIIFALPNTFRKEGNAKITQGAVNTRVDRIHPDDFGKRGVFLHYDMQKDIFTLVEGSITAVSLMHDPYEKRPVNVLAVNDKITLSTALKHLTDQDMADWFWNEMEKYYNPDGVQETTDLSVIEDAFNTDIQTEQTVPAVDHLSRRAWIQKQDIIDIIHAVSYLSGKKGREYPTQKQHKARVVLLDYVNNIETEMPVYTILYLAAHGLPRDDEQRNKLLGLLKKPDYLFIDKNQHVLNMRGQGAVKWHNLYVDFIPKEFRRAVRRQIEAIAYNCSDIDHALREKSAAEVRLAARQAMEVIREQQRLIDEGTTLQDVQTALNDYRSGLRQDELWMAGEVEAAQLEAGSAENMAMMQMEKTQAELARDAWLQLQTDVANFNLAWSVWFEKYREKIYKRMLQFGEERALALISGFDHALETSYNNPNTGNLYLPDITQEEYDQLYDSLPAKHRPPAIPEITGEGQVVFLNENGEVLE